MVVVLVKPVPTMNDVQSTSGKGFGWVFPGRLGRDLRRSVGTLAHLDVLGEDPKLRS